ncbi:MAG: DUF6429 family protein [Vicinamibacteria bacterium]|nr:DUF6429 family protein [Vicinamibacteria bacterium]
MDDKTSGINWDKVEEMTLALMHLTCHETHGTVRSWKGHSWEALNRLHARGWISDPVGKAKSVVLTDEAARRSQDLFEKHFGPST